MPNNFINKVHIHKDPIRALNVNLIKALIANFKVLERKGICCKYRTRSWKRRNRGNQEVAMNQVSIVLYLAKVAPTELDFQEHEHNLCIIDLRAILLL